MKINRIVAVVLALSLAFPAVPAVAQQATVDGEVKKIDEASGKITLKHGPIKKLEMDDPMRWFSASRILRCCNPSRSVTT